ncbi:MAG: adenylate/guanylate cyclase domain-containing protein [Candidatus Riflebacteria bacterium]
MAGKKMQKSSPRLKVGIGISISRNSSIASERAVKRAISLNPEPELAIVFASGKHDQKTVLETVGKMLEGVLITGCSTFAELTNAGCTFDSVVVTLFSSNSLEFNLYTAPCGDSPESAGSHIASQILQDHPHVDLLKNPLTALMFSYEGHFSGISYLKGIEKSLNFKLPISGGGSLNRHDLPPEKEFFCGYQYFNHELKEKNANLLLLKSLNPDLLSYSYAFKSTWSPVARPVKCTKADGAKVFEIDGKPLRNYYQEIFGPDILHDPDALSKYTFIVTMPSSHGELKLVRTPGAIDEADGSATFFPNVDMQDLTMQLVQISRKELIDGAKEAALNASAALHGLTPKIVFAFSCQLRNKYLHTMASREVEEIQKVFGANVPLVGFYAGGEYSPLHSNYADNISEQSDFVACNQLSTSISLLVIGEKCDSQEASLDYCSLLKNWIEEDKLEMHSVECEKIYLANLKKKLKESEEMLITTETTLKHLNSQHFNLAGELERKNVQLQEMINQNNKLQKIIEQYTPKTVWEKAHKSVALGLYRIPDEEVKYAIMFMDIKGFTSYAEKNSPVDVIRELNRIYQPATQIIYANNGDIDKFIGDCIFALFNHTEDAVKCALEVQAEMKTLQAEGLPFALRIGLNRGRVIRGNVGGHKRRDNTLIGDAVNFAQRLESNCTPGNILLSQEAFEDISPLLHLQECIEKREIQVKGKQNLFTVYEIVCS